MVLLDLSLKPIVNIKSGIITDSNHKDKSIPGFDQIFSNKYDAKQFC